MSAPDECRRCRLCRESGHQIGRVRVVGRPTRVVEVLTARQQVACAAFVLLAAIVFALVLVTA